MKVYELIIEDKRRNETNSELYEKYLDAWKEMWDAIQRRLLDGVLLTELNPDWVILSEQKEIGEEVHDIFSISVHEKIVHTRTT